MRVLFFTRHVPWPWLRQTPKGDGAWENLTFLLNEPETPYDWLVVYDEPPQALKTTVPREKRILFITEPPGIKTYPKAFLAQFGTVVSPYDLPGVTGRFVRRQTALPWHYG